MITCKIGVTAVLLPEVVHPLQTGHRPRISKAEYSAVTEDLSRAAELVCLYMDPRMCCTSTPSSLTIMRMCQRAVFVAIQMLAGSCVIRVATVLFADGCRVAKARSDYGR